MPVGGGGPPSKVPPLVTRAGRQAEPWALIGRRAWYLPDGSQDGHRPLDVAMRLEEEEFQGLEPGTPNSKGFGSTCCLHVDLQGRSSAQCRALVACSPEFAHSPSSVLTTARSVQVSVVSWLAGAPGDVAPRS